MSFMDEARARARRRRTRWNLLLIPAVAIPWLAAWWFSISALGRVYRLMHPSASFSVLPDTIGGTFMVIGPLIAWLPVAMVVGNLLVHAVPAARRSLDREATTVPGTDFGSSNRGLLRASAVLVPVGLAVGLLGLCV